MSVLAGYIHSNSYQRGVLCYKLLCICHPGVKIKLYRDWSLCRKRTKDFLPWRNHSFNVILHINSDQTKVIICNYFLCLLSSILPWVIVRNVDFVYSFFIKVRFSWVKTGKNLHSDLPQNLKPCFSDNRKLLKSAFWRRRPKVVAFLRISCKTEYSKKLSLIFGLIYSYYMWTVILENHLNLVVLLLLWLINFMNSYENHCQENHALFKLSI